jgi:tRNA(fMet)-specific endonuclease VapC
VARRLILDTGVLVRAERGRARLDRVLDDTDDVAVAAITVAELLVGVELADDDRRAARSAFVDDVIATIAIEDYTLDVAVAHARLLAYVRRAGRPRGAHDLVIAATGAATGRTVLTPDAKAGLADLPGVDALVVGRAG